MINIVIKINNKLRIQDKMIFLMNNYESLIIVPTEIPINPTKSIIWDVTHTIEEYFDGNLINSIF